MHDSRMIKVVGEMNFLKGGRETTHHERVGEREAQHTQSIEKYKKSATSSSDENVTSTGEGCVSTHLLVQG